MSLSLSLYVYIYIHIRMYKRVISQALGLIEEKTRNCDFVPRGTFRAPARTWLELSLAMPYGWMFFSLQNSPVQRNRQKKSSITHVLLNISQAHIVQSNVSFSYSFQSCNNIAVWKYRCELICFRIVVIVLTNYFCEVITYVFRKRVKVNIFVSHTFFYHMFFVVLRLLFFHTW